MAYWFPALALGLAFVLWTGLVSCLACRIGWNAAVDRGLR